MPKELLKGAITPAIGGAPYGDLTETTGPPEVEVVYDIYREFLATDARSILIVMHPHHWNFILNPAMRVDSTGWSVTGSNLSSPGGDPNYLNSDSWVGQSFYLSGDSGSITFNDPIGAGWGTYVGVSKDILTDDWYEPGRGSGQWTYTAYVKGACRARLRMRAWAPEDQSIAYSPPKYWGIVPQADPGSAPYDAAKPAIVDSATGNVWLLKEPEYYRQIGRPPRISSPSTYVPTTVPEEYILNGATAEVWKRIQPVPASAPYYALVTPNGSYVDKVNTGLDPTNPAFWDPYTAPPTSKYIRYIDTNDPTRNEIIWEVISAETTPGMTYYEDSGQKQFIGEAWNEWQTILDDGEWHRLILQTNVRWDSEDSNWFLGCAWIQAWLEFEDAEGARFSAFMLDPTEYPVAQYFDGSMTEDAIVDDFLWATSRPEHVNNSVSEYYYDRLARVRFIQAHLAEHVPTGRTYQIFMGSYDDAYIPPDDSTTRRLNLHRKI